MKARVVVRLAIVALTIAASSCGSAVRDGTGTSFLIITKLEASSGATPDEFGATLLSDVVTAGGVINDNGQVTFSLGLKDPGSADSPNKPTQNQSITIDRYRVRYIRADGRNTPGVDVPYAFDGAITLTVSGQGGSAGFLLVRHTAKREAPLAALANDFVKISTIAEITFYGHDLTGHEVSAVGHISIDFGNFADPAAS
jgi:hypothetical protein